MNDGRIINMQTLEKTREVLNELESLHIMDEDLSMYRRLTELYSYFEKCFSVKFDGTNEDAVRDLFDAYYNLRSGLIVCLIHYSYISEKCREFLDELLKTEESYKKAKEVLLNTICVGRTDETTSSARVVINLSAKSVRLQEGLCNG